MELDLRDKKLIYNLDFNARMPLTQLAKKLHVSKQVASYRIDNLTEKNIIQSFYTDINPSALGLQIYLVYLSFHRITPHREKQFITHIAKQKSVGVSVSLNGTWDFCIGIWAKSVFDFKNNYEAIMQRYETYVKHKTIMIETDFYYFKPKQILHKKDLSQITMHGTHQTTPITQTDKTILSNLANNARISLVDLSKKVHLTPNAIKNRIKNLEKNNVILAYRVMINYQLLGFLHYRIFLHLQNLTKQKEATLRQYLKQQQPIVSITKTIGYCDLEFRAIVKDIHEFYDLIDKLRNRFPHTIKNHESIIYYKFHEALNYYPFS